MQVQFLADTVEANDQLAAWGLDREMLIEAALFGQSFYNECTDNDPLGFEFSIAYARAGRRLRDLFGPSGWLNDNSNNQTAIRHEERRLRLYPCNFCSNTANPGRSPRNLTNKGSAAKSDTSVNAQIPLPFFDAPHMVPSAAPILFEKYTTLILGMNFEAEYAKAEVSLPVKFLNGKFSGLAIRVPLLNGTDLSAIRNRKDNPNDLFGVVDIPVARKI